MAENLADYQYSTPIPIRFSDIDAFGNVSNTIYLTYFEIARSNLLERNYPVGYEQGRGYPR
jgi:acyl-CoA thioester hydrolase